MSLYGGRSDECDECDECADEGDVHDVRAECGGVDDEEGEDGREQSHGSSKTSSEIWSTGEMIEGGWAQRAGMDDVDTVLEVDGVGGMTWIAAETVGDSAMDVLSVSSRVFHSSRLVALLCAKGKNSGNEM